MTTVQHGLHAPKEKEEAKPDVRDDRDLDVGDIMCLVHVNPAGVEDGTSIVPRLRSTFVELLRYTAGVACVDKRDASEERGYEVGGSHCRARQD
jgi:hypothetical protein